MPRNDSPTIGLLAAWGRFPLEVVDALRRNNLRVACAAVRHHANPQLSELCDEFTWVGIGRLGAAIRFFRRNGVRQATMAGKFHKQILYQPWVWLRHVPDWKGIKAFYPHMIAGKKDNKDDSLLTTLTTAFGEHGIEFAPATQFATDLLVGEGYIAGGPLSDTQMRDVQFGWTVARAMGGLDIGQSVCVARQAVLAVEAIEGTDACIARAGSLCRRGDFSVVKVAKPNQDMRFDVPTVGLGTLETMSASGGRVLAVEADRTILLDRHQFQQVAAAKGICVVALRYPLLQAA